MKWADVTALLKSKEKESPDDKARLILKYIYNLHADTLFNTNAPKYEIKNQANCEATSWTDIGANYFKRNFCKLNNVSLDQSTGEDTIGNLWENTYTDAYEVYKNSQTDVEKKKELQKYYIEEFEKIFKVPDSLDNLVKNIATELTLKNAAKEKIKVEEKENELKLAEDELSKLKKDRDLNVRIIKSSKEKIKKNNDLLDKLKVENEKIDESIKKEKDSYEKEKDRLKINGEVYYGTDDKIEGCKSSASYSECSIAKLGVSYEQQRENALKKVKEKHDEEMNNLKMKKKEKQKKIKELELDVEKEKVSSDTATQKRNALSKTMNEKRVEIEKKKDICKNEKKKLEECSNLIENIESNLEKATNKQQEFKDLYKIPEDEEKSEEQLTFSDIDPTLNKAKELVTQLNTKYSEMTLENLPEKSKIEEESLQLKQLLATMKTLLKLDPVKNFELLNTVRHHLIILYIHQNNNEIDSEKLNAAKAEPKQFTAEKSSFAPFRIYKYRWSPNTQEEEYQTVSKRTEKKSRFKNLRY